MIRRPPRSTPFPTRRSSDLVRGFPDLRGFLVCAMVHRASPLCDLLRSEEHTSELQSLAYLVCRLLLEKKKRIFDAFGFVFLIYYVVVLISLRLHRATPQLCV